MNGKHIFGGCALFLFLWTLSTGCGSSGNADEEGEGTVFDTVPVFEKDTFLYPLSTRSSSYLFPEVNYGEVKAFDDDPGTSWQTLPGLVTGEYIEFDFDSLFLSAVDLTVGNELRLARVKNVKVYTEGNLLGTFPPGGRIPIGKKLNLLRIELGETDGINKIDIPFTTDSTRAVLTEAVQMESIYSSKSAAISEIRFYGENNARLPIRSLPVKKAKMNLYGSEKPQAVYNGRLMFDGRKGFGWKGPENAPDEKVLLFSFDEDQVINGLFFPFTENLNVTKIGFRLRKRPLPEYKVVAGMGNGIFIPLKNTLKGKNFELLILETRNNETPFIPELLFHDGSRLFSVYSDSLEFFQKQRVDSAQGTPLAGFLDSRIVGNTSEKEYAHPLNVIFAKTKTVKDTLPQKALTVRTSFRLSSNGTFIIDETRDEQFFGPKPYSVQTRRSAEGYWLMNAKNGEESGVGCFAELEETQNRTDFGRPPVERTSRKTVRFDVTLLRNYVRFSDYFSPIVTGY